MDAKAERTTDRGGLEVLTYDACMSLLRDGYVGRVAYVADGEIAILPVNYRVHGSSIVFRTAIGGKLSAAERGRTASFQIDGWDELYQKGWSVLVKGILEDVTDADEVAELEEVPLTPWARKVERPYWVRLVPTEVTGRRIV